MLRFAQHDKSRSVIPNAVRNPVRRPLKKEKGRLQSKQGEGQSRAWVSSRLQRKTPQGALNARPIRTTKQVQMHQQRVKIVDIYARLPLWGKRKGSVVGLK